MNPQYKDSSYEDNQSDLSKRIGRPYGDFYETESLKILKNRGFFGVTLPVMHVLPGTMPQTSANYTTPFFRANRSYQVIECSLRFEHEETNFGTVDILKVASGVAPASGTSVLAAPISVAGTKNTDTPGALSTVSGATTIPAGTCLCLKPKTTPSMLDITGLTIYVLLKAI